MSGPSVALRLLAVSFLFGCEGVEPQDATPPDASSTRERDGGELVGRDGGELQERDASVDAGVTDVVFVTGGGARRRVFALDENHRVVAQAVTDDFGDATLQVDVPVDLYLRIGLVNDGLSYSAVVGVEPSQTIDFGLMVRDVTASLTFFPSPSVQIMGDCVFNVYFPGQTSPVDIAVPRSCLADGRSMLISSGPFSIDYAPITFVDGATPELRGGPWVRSTTTVPIEVVTSTAPDILGPYFRLNGIVGSTQVHATAVNGSTYDVPIPGDGPLWLSVSEIREVEQREDCQRVRQQFAAGFTLAGGAVVSDLDGPIVPSFTTEDGSRQITINWDVDRAQHGVQRIVLRGEHLGLTRRWIVRVPANRGTLTLREPADGQIGLPDTSVERRLSFYVAATGSELEGAVRPGEQRTYGASYCNIPAR